MPVEGDGHGWTCLFLCSGHLNLAFDVDHLVHEVLSAPFFSAAGVLAMECDASIVKRLCLHHRTFDTSEPTPARRKALFTSIRPALVYSPRNETCTI